MMNECRSRWAICSVLFVAVSLANACFSAKPFYLEEDKKVALKAVERLHELYNGEKFEEMLQMFVPSRIGNTAEQERFIAAMKESHMNRGKIVAYYEVKYEIVPEASHRVVRFLFRTDFEKGKYGEGFVLLVNNNGATLDSYFQTDNVPALK